MDCILLTNLPLHLVLAINHCRITCPAFYWLDIATGWGNGVSSRFLQPPQLIKPSSWLWPPETPSRSDWLTWATFLQDSSYTSKLQFLVPLGPWTSMTHCLDFVPFNPVSSTAFTKGHNQYWRLFHSDSPRPYHLLCIF